MAYSDIVVLKVLSDLLTSRGEEEVISIALIAETSDVPVMTCRRALKRLMLSGRVQGAFTIGIGYHYRILNGSTPERRSSAVPGSA